MVELYVRPSTLVLTTPPAPLPSTRAGVDIWSPWPMTTPRLSARTDELNMARAELGVIMRDMLGLQQQHGTAAMDSQYTNAARFLHTRYQDWMGSLQHGLHLARLHRNSMFYSRKCHHFAMIHEASA